MFCSGRTRDYSGRRARQPFRRDRARRSSSFRSTVPFVIECIGLRASARKRLAQVAFASGRAEKCDLRSAKDCLRPARRRPSATTIAPCAACSSATAGRSQRIATLHWLAVQLESLVAPSSASPWNRAAGKRRSFARTCTPSIADARRARLGAGKPRRAVAADGLPRRQRRRREQPAESSATACSSMRGARAPVSVARRLSRHVDAAAVRALRRLVGNPRFERDLAAHGFERRAAMGKLEARRPVRSCEPTSAVLPLRSPVQGSHDASAVRRGSVASGRRSAVDRPEPARPPPLPRLGSARRRARRTARPARDATAVLRRRDAAGRARRLPLDRIRRRASTHRWLIDWRHAGERGGTAAARRSASGARSAVRASRPVAHRFGPHRRRAAAHEDRPERAALRRRLVQRMAAPFRSARLEAGRNVLVCDRRTSTCPGTRGGRVTRSSSTATICRQQRSPEE